MPSQPTWECYLPILLNRTLIISRATPKSSFRKVNIQSRSERPSRPPQCWCFSFPQTSKSCLMRSWNPWACFLSVWTPSLLSVSHSLWNQVPTPRVISNSPLACLTKPKTLTQGLGFVSTQIIALCFPSLVVRDNRYNLDTSSHRFPSPQRKRKRTSLPRVLASCTLWPIWFHSPGQNLFQEFGQDGCFMLPGVNSSNLIKLVLWARPLLAFRVWVLTEELFPHSVSLLQLAHWARLRVKFAFTSHSNKSFASKAKLGVCKVLHAASEMLWSHSLSCLKMIDPHFLFRLTIYATL